MQKEIYRWQEDTHVQHVSRQAQHTLQRVSKQVQCTVSKKTSSTSIDTGEL